MNDETQKTSKQAAKRQSTEQRILNAFERLLKKVGANQIGINALVKEAKVGKGLIYEYFGGLEGVANAWANQSDFVLSKEAVIGEDESAFLAKPPAQRIAEVHVNYANSIRKSSIAVETLLEELNTHKSSSEAFAVIRSQLGKTHEQIFTELTPLETEEDMALCMILLAAANYFAIRANSSPNYNGIHLDTEEGWQQITKMFHQVSKRSQ